MAGIFKNGFTLFVIRSTSGNLFDPVISDAVNITVVENEYGFSIEGFIKNRR